MNTKTLISQNNEKRKQLNEENKKVYQDMLLYIRLSYAKSEQETEEILMELLDHLLEAQQEGRTATDIFGDDPRSYADEISGELPKMMTKKRMMYGMMAVLYFLAASTFFNGLINTVLYYGFHMTELEPVRTYYLGSVAVLTILSICIAFIVLYFFFMYLCWACFKNMSKLAEFSYVGLFFGALPFGVFLILFYVMPNFGPTVTFSVYWLMALGAMFLVMALLIKKFRIGETLRMY